MVLIQEVINDHDHDKPSKQNVHRPKLSNNLKRTSRRDIGDTIKTYFERIKKPPKFIV